MDDDIREALEGIGQNLQSVGREIVKENTIEGLTKLSYCLSLNQELVAHYTEIQKLRLKV